MCGCDVWMVYVWCNFWVITDSRKILFSSLSLPDHALIYANTLLATPRWDRFISQQQIPVHKAWIFNSWCKPRTGKMTRVKCHQFYRGSGTLTYLRMHWGCFLSLYIIFILSLCHTVFKSILIFPKKCDKTCWCTLHFCTCDCVEDH